VLIQARKGVEVGRAVSVGLMHVDKEDREFRHVSFSRTLQILLGNPAACRGHMTDGGSPVESRSITPQGGEALALPFGRPRRSNPVVDIT